MEDIKQPENIITEMSEIKEETLNPTEIVTNAENEASIKLEEVKDKKEKIKATSNQDIKKIVKKHLNKLIKKNEKEKKSKRKDKKEKNKKKIKAVRAKKKAKKNAANKK